MVPFSPLTMMGEGWGEGQKKRTKWITERLIESRTGLMILLKGGSN